MSGCDGAGMAEECTSSRTMLLQHSRTGTQFTASCLFSGETLYKTRTVSSPEIIITACCFCLRRLLTVILLVRGSSGTTTDHYDPAQLLWFLMHGPKINSLLIRKAEKLVWWGSQKRTGKKFCNEEGEGKKPWAGSNAE